MAVGLLKRLLSINRLVWIFYLVCASWFVYLVFHLQGCYQFQDDLSVAVPFVSTVVLGGTSVVLKCNGHVLLCVFCKVRCEVRKSGWLRCVLFVLFACFFSYFSVTVALDKSLIFGWNLSKKHLVGLMEKNIIDIEDIRRSDLDSDGVFYRYEGEDVQLLRHNDVIIWMSHGLPADDVLINMTWRLNDAPITWSDRHSYNVTWTELTDDEKINVSNVIGKREIDILASSSHVSSSQLNRMKARWSKKKIKMIWKRNHFRLSMYRVVTNIEIRLLEASDFGKYTWSGADLRERLHNHIYSIMRTLHEKNWCHQVKRREKWPNVTACEMVYRFRKHQDEVVRASRMIFTMFRKLSSENEFRQNTRTMRLHDRKIRRALPPGAIVSVTASYWQNEQDQNEIAVDYLINERSLRSSASVWLCSKLLLLYYWMSKSESCLRSVDFCIPPLESIRGYHLETDKAEPGLFIFCLGPETYGWLEVEFYRQYYNSSTKQYELVRVVFPVATFIQPEKQNLISDLLSYNDSSTYAYNAWNAYDWIPTNLEMQLTRQLAHAEALYFHREELIFIGALAVVCIVILIGLLHVIDKAGTLCKKLILKRPVPPNHTRDRNNEDNDGDAEREVSRPQYDIFLSLSETDAGRTGTCIVNIAEALKQRVFFPVRDVPPNLPELSVVDAAIENSRRFVILFSRNYRQQDRLFEAEAIVNSVRLRCQNFPQTILVVKLDYSELPGWLTQCSVIDWTFFGPMEHHLLNLQAWIISGCTFGHVELLFLTLVRL